MLINIDNGGTFTDVCAISGSGVYRTKTPTTPFDLSECFFEGLRKISTEIFGRENLSGLLAETKKIRYSTTQGTNALVQRKGPRLGLILAAGTDPAILRESPQAGEMLDALVEDRFGFVDFSLQGEAFEAQIVSVINALTLAGANRLVLSVPELADERAIERVIGRHFPEHLLGTVPVIAAGELSRDPSLARRSWTGLLNAFLHPAMEKFLYYAENRLREQKFVSPLLIYRNDGDSGRVAKTVAIKSYSSGPRGGMDGVLALARHYGYPQVLSMDVGGTTTDIGLVENGAIRQHPFGQVDGATICLPLTDIVSVGVGGGSIIRAQDGVVAVGPQSVGAAPGPACFGLGGSDATITDYALLAGLIDPATYFGGAMALDAERAALAVATHVAGPLGLEEDQALLAMEEAWAGRAAEALQSFTDMSDETVLCGFGGAGPLVACHVAEKAGIRRVLIPNMASVFCALGIGFSEVGHSYEVELPPRGTEADFRQLLKQAEDRAVEDMAAEGFTAADCRFEYAVASYLDGHQSVTACTSADEAWQRISGEAQALLRLRVAAAMPQPDLGSGRRVAPVAPVQAGTREILLAAGQRRAVPLVMVADQPAGAQGVGPAMLEDPYYTLCVAPGWSFEFTEGRDILLTRVTEQSR